ncbi:MAG: abortive infection family protein, partial [Thermodesulfobacteriota bacterium]|nr:abortive infection family protein [Thermodesulfobacteriota bacterium]
MTNEIPRPIIAVIADIFSDHYSHAELNRLYSYADAPGDRPEGSKKIKCLEWLARCNKDESVDALKILGKLLEEFMEVELDGRYRNIEDWEKKRARIEGALANYGLAYLHGGHVRKSGTSGPTRSLKQILRDKDLAAVDKEFERAMETIESDPPASLTAACAIIESLCKIYIEDRGLDLPKEQSIKPLWNIVKKDLGFDPSRIEDQDLLKILTGLNSIVDGLGALRTHAGSAHGRGKKIYKVQPRHARLAVHTAH